MIADRPLAELNLWQRLFAGHWDEFTAWFAEQTGKPVPERWTENVRKLLGCGDVRNGYSEYVCEECGTVRKAGFTCKSRLCLRCFKVAVDKLLRSFDKVLFEGVVHRQIVLTLPRELWALVLAEAGLQKVFCDAGAKAVLDLIREWRPKKQIQVGISLVLQLCGRAGNPNPHLHLVVSEGGIDKEGQWRHVNYFDTKKLRKKWQYEVLTALRRAVKGTAHASWDEKLGRAFHDYPRGFDVHAMPEKGLVDRLVVYLCKYINCPPISIRRIEAYDGKNVTFRYEDHRRGLVHETLPAVEFIGRMIQHLPEKNFRMVRHYGIYARNVRNKLHESVKGTLDRLVQASARVRGILTGKPGRHGTGLTAEQYRAEIEGKFGDHSIRCKVCRRQMRLVRVWTTKDGFVYDITAKLAPKLRAALGLAPAAVAATFAPTLPPQAPKPPEQLWFAFMTQWAFLPWPARSR
jgi:hypothetical protein